jgi:predicted transposase YbfD/YdcC
MQAHHYLGSLPKIGHTLWYIATWRSQWLALLSFSAAALKCAARDNWIGWDFRHQYDRLHLIANNSRFLILPEHHYPNLASRILSLCERRLAQDWPARFGHPLWLLETFVDPCHFHGTIYRAANWVYVGDTRGFRRTRKGYSATAQAPKRVFLRPLVPHVQARLSCPILDPTYCHGAPKLMLSAEHMRSLPAFFADIPDPRRAQGRRHRLPVVLAIATAAVLCGARGYKAISEWADDLGQKARARFRCRYRDGRYEVPSRTLFREVLTRVDPASLDLALQGWNGQFAATDEGLAIDGKTMCNAIDEDGRQTHILSIVGHQTKTCYTQKKVAALPVDGSEEVKQTNEIGMFIPLLEDFDIAGKTITADALLTQRKLARYLVEARGAHYLFTAKDNQPTLLADIRLMFEGRGKPDFREPLTLAHGRLESRAIWTTTRLNDYLDFPGVGQAFAIERQTIEKKTGKVSNETVYGLTSHTPESADAARLLAFNRDHWGVESHHYILDWNWDEDRCTLRTGHGPENITRLRRFATGLIKSKSRDSVAATIRKFARNVRHVFDYLRLTGNSIPRSQRACAQAG